MEEVQLNVPERLGQLMRPGGSCKFSSGALSLASWQTGSAFRLYLIESFTEAELRYGVEVLHRKGLVRMILAPGCG